MVYLCNSLCVHDPLQCICNYCKDECADLNPPIVDFSQPDTLHWVMVTDYQQPERGNRYANRLINTLFNIVQEIEFMSGSNLVQGGQGQY